VYEHFLFFATQEKKNYELKVTQLELEQSESSKREILQQQILSKTEQVSYIS